MERCQARSTDRRSLQQNSPPRCVIPLGRDEAAVWCGDLATVGRAHGWHPKDAVFLQLGRFCAYLRGAEHRKLSHPVILAPKQDFLSLVPITCPPGRATYVDAQAITDAVAVDPDVTRVVGCIYRFANSCEQVRTRPLPPPHTVPEGLDPREAAALESRIAEKIAWLQDLADNTTRMLSAVFNSVSPQVILDSSVAGMSAAVESLVGSRLADTGIAAPSAPETPEALGLGASPVPAADAVPETARPEGDPLRAIWNEMAAIRDLIRSRVVATEKQRRLSSAAEDLQARVIRVVESSLSSPHADEAQGEGSLDALSDAVVARVNFERLGRAIDELPSAVAPILDLERLAEETASLQRELAGAVGEERASELCARMARVVEAERSVDRAIDRLLEVASDRAAAAALVTSLREHLAELLDAVELERLITPLESAVREGEGPVERQALRDHGVALLLALSAQGERRLESLFSGEEVPEEDAWRLHRIYRALVGANIARCLADTITRIRQHLGTDSVPIEPLLSEKQVLWGLAYEVVNWVETRQVAAAVAANAQPFEPARGTFSELRLASGEVLAEVAARACGLQQPLEAGLTLAMEAPILLSSSGELLMPARAHKIIGGITEAGSFRLSRQATRWDVAEAAELMACAESRFWGVFHSALGATTPSPAALLEALDCAAAMREAGSRAEVWCGVASLASPPAGHASLFAYRPDPERGEELRAAAREVDALLNEFGTALDARLEENDVRLRATGYVPPAAIAAYREAGALLKETLRAFGAEHFTGKIGERWLRRAHEEVDGFVHFAGQALHNVQRQGARMRQSASRLLIAALYEIDDRRVLMRHLLHGLVRDTACEERLVSPGLLQAAETRVLFDAGQMAESLPTAPEALPEARLAAFLAGCLGGDADAEQKRRANALCTLAGEGRGATEEPGPASALLFDLLRPLLPPLLERSGSRPLLAPEVFDSFVAALREHCAPLRRYLCVRPTDSGTADAAFLALVVRGMGGRRASRAPLWEPLSDALRRGVSLGGYPVFDLVHLSDPEEAARLLDRLHGGDLAEDARLASRVADEARKELGIEWETAPAEVLASARDELLAMLHRHLTRACERLEPERALLLRLAAGTLTDEDRQQLLSGQRETRGGKGKRARKGQHPAPAVPQTEPDPSDLAAARARLAESVRRYAEYEHLCAMLHPYAGDTTDPLYALLLAAVEGRSAEIVRPPLNGITPLASLAPAATVGEAAPATAALEPAAPQPAPRAAEVYEGPVRHFLDEFSHLGSDPLAADLVEAALVLFPTHDHVRETLTGNRKQVLDAILAREFPAVMRSTRMQIVVAAEPRGLRLHDISDLLKMVSEGGVSPSEVRNLLRSI